jgi:FdhE protein
MTNLELTQWNRSVLTKILNSANALEKDKPFFKEIILFYKKIFLTQYESDPDIVKDYSGFTNNKDFPCINIKDFDIDFTNAEKTFQNICKICLYSGKEMSFTADIMLESIEKKDVVFKKLVEIYLQKGHALPKVFVGKKEFKPEVFDFIIYNSIKPSIVKSSRIIASYLKKQDQAGQGICPVCGSLPALSVLSGENGSRSLVCSFCWHEWETTRITCPFCGNHNNKTLGYCLIENEKGIRADYCDKCKKYIKTIDLREYGHDCHYPMELLASMPFDMKMKAKGYNSE